MGDSARNQLLLARKCSRTDERDSKCNRRSGIAILNRNEVYLQFGSCYTVLMLLAKSIQNQQYAPNHAYSRRLSMCVLVPSARSFQRSGRIAYGDLTGPHSTSLIHFFNKTKRTSAWCPLCIYTNEEESIIQVLEYLSTTNPHLTPFTFRGFNKDYAMPDEMVAPKDNNYFLSFLFHNSPRLVLNHNGSSG